MADQPNISRRSFLGGALALTAATALPSPMFASAPTIYGDGVHDDTAGLQAALDGKPFRIVGEGAYVVNKGGSVYLGRGNFRLSSTLDVGGSTVIADAIFDARDIPKDGRPVLRMNGMMGTALTNVHVQGNGAGTAMAFRCDWPKSSHALTRLPDCHDPQFIH